MDFKFFSRFSFIASCFVLVAFFSVAQENQKEKLQTKIDSLTKVLKKTNADSVRVNRQNNLADLYLQLEDFQHSKIYANKAIQLSKKLGYDKGLTQAYINLGAIYRTEGKSQESINYLHKARQIALSEKLSKEESDVYDQLGHLKWAQNDTTDAIRLHEKALAVRKKMEVPLLVAHSSDNLGYIYSKKGDYNQAANYYNVALVNYKKINKTHGIALSHGNLGLMHYWKGNRQVAITNFIEAGKYYEKENDVDGIVWTNGLISNVYQSLKDYETALVYIKKSLKIHEENGDILGLADCYYLLGANYIELNQFDQANKYLTSAKEIYEDAKEEVGVTLVEFNFGNLAFRKKEYQKAIDILNKVHQDANRLNHVRMIGSSKQLIGSSYLELGNAIQANKWLNEALNYYLNIDSKGSLPFIYRKLAQTDSLQGNFRSAFENYKQYIALNADQNVSGLETEKLAMKLEFEKKEALAEAELKNKQLERNAAFYGLCLMIALVVGLILIIRLRNKKIKIEKQNLEFQKREVQSAKELEQFKSRFLANISHEFRTPLTLINAQLELLKKNANAADLRRFNEMEFNGKRLLQLINQLLELSRLEAGEYQLVYRNGQLIKEINVLAQSFHSFAEKKSIHYTYIISDEATALLNERKFYYSSEAVTIILTNLLSNAIKFTPHEGLVRLLVDVKENFLVIEVIDNGRGMDQVHLAKIFDRFYQVESGEQSVYEGSGIGLSLVKELAVLHGGDARVSSHKNEGCHFTITLKNAEKSNEELLVESEEIENEVAMSDAVHAHNNHGELPVVLVVEDHDDIRNFIVEVLSKNYQCYQAANGADGLSIANEIVPDLIITDNMMPDVSGLEMTISLKGNVATSHIPIIMLTAKVDERDRFEGLKAGVDIYLNKPFSMEELQLRAINLLKTSEAIRERFKGGKKIETVDDDPVEPQMNERDKEFIDKLTSCVSENIANKNLGVAMLCEAAFLSQSQLTRKLKTMVGKTPADFIRTIRLEQAHVLLQNNESVAEVGYAVGFDDPVYFSKVFKKHFGFPPSSSRKELI